MTLRRAMEIIEEERSKWIKEAETEYHGIAATMYITEVEAPETVVIVRTTEEYYDNDQGSYLAEIIELEDGFLVILHKSYNRVHWIGSALKRIRFEMWFD